MIVKQADELINIFNSVISEYKKCIDKISKKFNLYVGQTDILFLLDERSGRSQKELAGALGVSKATVGVSLRRMESAGLVNRATDPRDARCVRVSLTDKGMAICNKCKAAHKTIYASMFGDAGGEKRKAIYDVLDEINKELIEMRKK
ncbi:MAG: MarR family transcriptional regulator [Acidaminococcales bacterium]|jgi:DNA-binding MarR family transcriptional regulator|nr:MarR family transcriptional regulator [Acidaminococcales bacterium]